MVFIVIDGIDGSGKATQTNILKERLRKEGYKVSIFDFPRYGKPSASLVEDYLNGKFGSADSLSPEAASILFAIDRFAAKTDIENALKNGDIIISNRYVSSNMGHQAGKIRNIEKRKEFMNWLDNLEYHIFGIPRPDLSIFLDVPPRLGQMLVDKKGERNYLKGEKRDIHEADISHLTNAYGVFAELSEKDDMWVRIECVKNGKLSSTEEISELIWENISKLI